MEITKDDFDLWWNSHVGKEFRKMMKEDLDKIAYNTMCPSFARDSIGNAIEVGRFEAIMHYYNMNHTVLMGGKS